MDKYQLERLIDDYQDMLSGDVPDDCRYGMEDALQGFYDALRELEHQEQQSFAMGRLDNRFTQRPGAKTPTRFSAAG